MALNDDRNETISKNVVAWLNQVGGLISAISGIAAALATIFGLFLPNLGDDAKRITLGVAGALALGSGAVYFYRRRRMAKLKIAESLEPLSATAALRGLLPFEDGDQLPGRARDVQGLYTLVSSSTFRFGVLWGESGCGKTSLLRAGLVPTLRNEKFLPLYINKPTNDPEEVIRSTVLKEVESEENQANQNLDQLLKSVTPKGKTIVILIDQFEEFFVTNRTPRSRAGFIKWLGETVADESAQVKFLIGIRADFFAQLQNFAPQIPEPTSIRTTYQLQNFETEQAKQILNAAAIADGIPFEPALIQAVVKELETEEFIRPAELQVVGTRLKRKHVYTLNRYEALGGAQGILSAYINDEINQSLNQQTARLILRLMCVEAVETKSPTDLSMDDILQGISGTRGTTNQIPAMHPEEIQSILNQFVLARVLIHTDDDKYNLAHDYLASYVRTATEGTETNAERANRLLKRYVAEYKEYPKTRIPFGRTHWIERYATAEVKTGSKAQELIRKSKRTHYGMIALPTLLIAILYLFLASSYYFSIDNTYIAIRAGYPTLKFLPGFDQVVIQTDFKESDLEPGTREKYLREQVIGFWFQRTDGGYQVWGQQLAEGLSINAKMRALSWLGQPERAEQDLIEIVNNVRADPNERAEAAIALGYLALDHSEFVTPGLIQMIIDIITNPQIDYDLGNEVELALTRLIQLNPQAIPSEVVESLVNVATSQETNYDLNYYSITGAIPQLVQSNPESLTHDILQNLVDFVTDRSIEWYTRSAVVDILPSIIAAKPQIVTGQMLEMLVDFLIDPRSDADVRTSMLYSDWSFDEIAPHAITPEMLQKLVDFSINLQFDSELRSDAGYAFLSPLAQANPRAITTEMIQMLMEVIADPQTGLELRSSAMSVLSQLTQARPEIVTPDMYRKWVEILTDPQQDTQLRISAASALGQLAQTRPDVATSSMLQTMMEIIVDPQTDSQVRWEAAYTLGSLAQARPESVAPEMPQSLRNILTDIDSKSDLYALTLYSLLTISKSDLEILTPEMIQSIVDIIITDPQEDIYFRSDLAGPLGQIAQENPEILTPEMIQPLVDIITDPQEDIYFRLGLADTLGQIAQENPEIVTTEVIQSLFDLFTDPQWGDYERKSIADTLISLAQINTLAVTPDLLHRQMDVFSDPQVDPERRIYTAQALGFVAQANPEVISSEMIMTLIDLLKSDVNSPGRQAAVYPLFGVAFGDTERENMIRKELVEMQTAAQPHRRMAASRVLEILDFSSPLAEAARAHPDQIGEIELRLTYVIYNSPYIFYYSNESHDSEHFYFAAQVVFREITKIEEETSE